MTWTNRDSNEGDHRAPSREEIECLCILHAVGVAGCPTGELASRLGLSPSLSSSVAEGAEPLIRRGWLDRADDRFSLTEAGHTWLTERLSDLKVGDVSQHRA
jgi:predicted transcriptional regulator